MNSIIEKFAKDVASEIISRPNFDLEETTILIKVRLKDSLNEILLANCEHAELVYQRLLQEQGQHRYGSSRYVEFGYKLAAAKSKKSLANRTSSNVRREDKYKKSCDFIKANFGDEKLEEFFYKLRESEVENGK